MKKGPLKRAVLPKGGIYYLVPSGPGGRWRVRARHADDAGCAALAHSEFWNEVVDGFLAKTFSLNLEQIAELAEATYGLPRGRVVPPGTHKRGRDAWLILHGADEPVPGARKRILEAFGLMGAARRGRVRWLFDEHETTQPWDRKTVSRVLGVAVKSVEDYGAERLD